MCWVNSVCKMVYVVYSLLPSIKSVELLGEKWTWCTLKHKSQLCKSILFAVLNCRRQWSHITQLKPPPNPKLFEASSFRSPFDEYLDLLHRIHHTPVRNVYKFALVVFNFHDFPRVEFQKKSCLYPPDPNSHGNSLTPASPQVGSNRFLGVADNGGGPGAPQLTLEGEVVAFQLRAAEVLNPRRNGDFMGDFKWGLPWTWTHMTS